MYSLYSEPGSLNPILVLGQLNHATPNTEVRLGVAISSQQLWRVPLGIATFSVTLLNNPFELAYASMLAHSNSHVIGCLLTSQKCSKSALATDFQIPYPE